MGAHVTKLNRPALEKLTLYREVVLLGVRRVRLQRRAGKRGQVDRTVGCRAAIVQTRLTLIVNKDWTDSRIINVQRPGAADASQSGKMTPRGYIRGRDTR